MIHPTRHDERFLRSLKISWDSERNNTAAPAWKQVMFTELEAHNAELEARNRFLTTKCVNVRSQRNVLAVVCVGLFVIALLLLWPAPVRAGFSLDWMDWDLTRECVLVVLTVVGVGAALLWIFIKVQEWWR